MAEIRTWRASDAAELLGVPGVDTHKYSRGVLGLRTGSSAYPGAAVLGAESAWRTGLGVLRYFPQHDDASPRFGLPSPAAAVLAMRPETVFSTDSPANRSRCDAWLIGSGTDADSRSLAETAALTEILAGLAPVVVDAGALDLVTTGRTNAPIVITPHFGEFRRLWFAAGLGDADALYGADHAVLIDAAASLAQRLEVTVVLKGSRTIAATTSGSIYVVGPATPWLATAGTGDVLAGILGALVAAHATNDSSEIAPDSELLARLGATAALLHDLAARLVLSHWPGHPAVGPITALDVAHALPRASVLLSAQPDDAAALLSVERTDLST